jgi:D-alanyl-D-alanine carboxypeptidase (penicillin-binding protein 5/6)
VKRAFVSVGRRLPSCVGISRAAFPLAFLAAWTAPAELLPASAGIKKVSRDPYLGAIVVDGRGGKALFQERADAVGYPASLVKLMDLLIVLEKIEAKELSLRDKVHVPAEATWVEPSKVDLREGQEVFLEDLLFALMIHSANDAAVAVAVHAAGSTEAFLRLMNARAKKLGMTSTTFRSVHGLPPRGGGSPDVTTARDMAKLCLAVLGRREALRYTSTREKPFPSGSAKPRTLRSHNPLLGKLEGCDGLKTGYTRASGFSLAATAERGAKRYVVVVLGSARKEARDAKARDLLTKAFQGRLAGSKKSTSRAGSAATAASGGAKVTRKK